MAIGTQIAVVGGGIIGICAASALARTGCDVFVLERRKRLFEESSTRNSGVVHAGLYYPPGSRKARACVRGNALTYEFCEAHDVPHRRCGKLVAAYSQKETVALQNLARNALESGARGVRAVSARDALAREPHLARPVAALLVESSGVLDVGEYLKTREREALSEGVQILCDAEVERIDLECARPVVRSSRGEMVADFIVNAAGLWTSEVEAAAGLAPVAVTPCRGEYYAVYGERAKLVNGLLYPVPGADLAGLGVHLTRTPADELLVGPNAVWTGRKGDYESDREGPERFLESARKLLPALRLADLREGYAGIRAKLVGPEDAPGDFEIERRGPGGRFISVRGIESPGLTAAPALGEEIASLVGDAAA